MAAIWPVASVLSEELGLQDIFLLFILNISATFFNQSHQIAGPCSSYSWRSSTTNACSQISLLCRKDGVFNLNLRSKTIPCNPEGRVSVCLCCGNLQSFVLVLQKATWQRGTLRAWRPLRQKVSVKNIWRHWATSVEHTPGTWPFRHCCLFRLVETVRDNNARQAE